MDPLKRRFKYLFGFCFEAFFSLKLWAKEVSGENVTFIPGRQKRKVSMTLLTVSVNNSSTDGKQKEHLPRSFSFCALSLPGRFFSTTENPKEGIR